MKMTKFMASLFATSLLTLAACSNDENDPIGGSDNSQEGVKTWARLDIKVGGPVTRATVDGSEAESKINKINVYVFNEAGQFEDKTTVDIPEDAHGAVHSSALALTSGKKKVYVLANMDDAWMPSPVPATQTQFEALVLDDFSALIRDENFFMSNALTGVDFTLYAGVTKEQASQWSDDPNVMAQNNHLQVTLSRAVAKIQVSYNKDAGDLFEIKDKDGTKPIGILDHTSLKFAIRNTSNSTYMFLHNRDNGFLTPHYTATNLNSLPDVFGTLFDKSALIEKEVKKDDQTPISVYVPENANQTPMVGNTTYAIVRASFRPKAGVMINAITVDESVPSNLKIVKTYDQTDYISNLEETVSPFFMTKDGRMFTLPKDVVMPDADRADYGYAMLLKDYLASNGKSQFLKATKSNPVHEGDVNSKRVYYACVGGDPQGIYQTAKIVKYTETSLGSLIYGDAEYITEIPFLQYNDGIVFYRINIQDKEDGKTDSNNLFYSVMRNRFYKVNIDSVSGIGTPSEDGSSDIVPETPINSKTYMQAHITVEPWTVVNQDADLGI